MGIKKSITSIKLLKCFLVLAVLSQILLPIYSDRNFSALAEGGLVQRICMEDVEHYPSDKCMEAMERSSFYDSLVFTTHYYFGDLGLLIFQVFVMLLISFLLARVMLDEDSKHSSLEFFLYLISLVGIFYGRDISPDHFFILGFLVLVQILKCFRFKSNDFGVGKLIRAILAPYLLIALLSLDIRFYLTPIILSLYLGLFYGARRLVWGSLLIIPIVIIFLANLGIRSYSLEKYFFEFAGALKAIGDHGFFLKPVGEELAHGVYAIAVSFLLLLLATLAFRNDLKQVIRLAVLVLLFGLSTFVPLFRMITPIFSLTLIFSSIDNSKGLTNISEIFSRFILSLNYLSGYALIFFLLAFTFTQANGAFKYPLTTLFMPVDKVDKMFEGISCIAEGTMFSVQDRRKYSGYLKYRAVYSGLREC